jgi:hypothetical protein
MNKSLHDIKAFLHCDEHPLIGWREFRCQFSPPLGATTVIAETIENGASLVSFPAGLALLVTFM